MERAFLIQAGIVVLLHLADERLTQWGLSLGFKEANSLARWIVQFPFWSAFTKALGVALLLWLMHNQLQADEASFWRVVIMHHVIMLAVVANNSWLIWSRLRGGDA